MKLYTETNGSINMKLYTDTDHDGKSEFISYVTIKTLGKASKLIVEVKVDPQADMNCILQVRYA